MKSERQGWVLGTCSINLKREPIEDPDKEMIKETDVKILIPGNLGSLNGKV